MNVFLTVAESLSFTETAKRLHMTQPSVSQHIQTLERIFATKLFIRRGRYIELTDDGRVLLPMAHDMVTLSSQIQETMNSLKGEVHGHLMVGCCTTPGKYVLPRLLARFHKIHPAVQVTCKVTGQNEAIEMLCNGDIQVSLTSSTQHIQYKNADFESFISEPIILIVPDTHPWAARGEINPEELYQESFILRESTSGTYEEVNKALLQVDMEISELKALLTLGNSEAIALSVQEGLGVGFVSKIVVSTLGLEHVTPVRIKGFHINQDIHIGYQMRHPASATQKAFRQFINGLEKPISGISNPRN
jgi:DNA-binding transcriptional LysR family regulator